MTYWLVKVLLTPVLRFFFRIRVEGLEHVPSRGPAILAANHLSFSDSFFLPLVLRRRITFVAKAEYFDDPRTAWFFRAVGQIPIRRSGGSDAHGALESARGVLRAGGLFGIYPEGTRSPDGRLYKGHTGVARLALENLGPVLAVAMVGTREVLPVGRLRPGLFRPVTIRISAPMSWTGAGAAKAGPPALRRVTDEIMFELARLSGQEYVERYAKKRDPEAIDLPEVTPVLAGPPLVLTLDDGHDHRRPATVA